MNICDFFQNIPIFVINLKNCVARREHCENEFKDYPEFRMIDAIDGRNTEEFHKTYNVKYDTSEDFNTALIAVICSHAKAMKIALNEGHENVIIFEDDVHTELISRCNFTIKDVMNKKDDWEIIQLYYTSELVNNNNHFKQNGIDLLPRNGVKSGTCYMINKKGIENILNNYIKVSDNLLEYDIVNPIIDPEHTIFCNVKSYIVNRPFVYYYFDSMSFNSYTNTENTEYKQFVQTIQKDSKNLLISLYK